MINSVNLNKNKANAYQGIEQGLNKRKSKGKEGKMSPRRKIKLRGEQKRDRVNIKNKNHKSSQQKSGTKIGKVINMGGRGKYKLDSPVRGGTTYISSRFGEDRGSYMHKGLDIDGKAGDNIYAAKKGEVVFSGHTERGGNEVVINHDNGLTTKYSHLDELNVEQGDKVSNKTVIGTMGSTGQVHTDDSDGDIAHLHYEVMKDGKNIDPEAFLDSEKTEYKRGDYGSGSCGGATSWEDFSDSSGNDTTDNTDSTNDTDDTNNTSNTFSGSCSGTMTDEEVDEKWEEWQDDYGDEETNSSNSPENTNESNPDTKPWQLKELYDQRDVIESKYDNGDLSENEYEEEKKRIKAGIHFLRSLIKDDYNSSGTCSGTHGTYELTNEEKREVEQQISNNLQVTITEKLAGEFVDALQESAIDDIADIAQKQQLKKTLPKCSSVAAIGECLYNTSKISMDDDLEVLEKIEKSGVEIAATLANVGADIPTEGLGPAGIPVSVAATEIINGAKEKYYEENNLN